MQNKPYAAAAEQNRGDILKVLAIEFMHANSVLEIGSGPGQHAIYFAEHLPHLTWQSSDKKEMLTGINLWIDEAGLTNVPRAIALDVTDKWPNEKFDAAYGANIAHIMHSDQIVKGRALKRVDSAERIGQHAGDVLAHMPDAQREQKPGKRGLLARFDRGHEVRRTLLAHSLEFFEVRHLSEDL